MRRWAGCVALCVAVWSGCGGGSGTPADDPGGDVAVTPDVAGEDAGPAADEGGRDLPGMPDAAPDPGPGDEGPLGDAAGDPGVADPGPQPVDEGPQPVDEGPQPVDPGPDVPPACERPAGPEDGPRNVFVSLPYDADTNPSNRWQVLTLGTDGSLSIPGITFEAKRQFMGEAAVTPDGKVLIVADEQDGTLAVVRMDPSGPVVVHPVFQGSFYATGVVMDPSGSRAWVLNDQWRENGGGIYAVSIACDGTLTDLGLVAPARLPARLVQLPSRRWVVPARDLLDVTEGDTFVLDLSGTPTVTASGTGFPDDEYVVGSAAVSPDGRFVLVGDNNSVYDPKLGLFPRVALTEIQGDALVLRQRIMPFPDPVGLAFSPWGNAVAAVDGFGNAVRRFAFDPEAASPLTQGPALTYVGVKPQLPGGLFLITRGSLKGLMLIPELSGVRRMRFEPDGNITDLGLTSFGEGMENMAGGFAVQP